MSPLRVAAETTNLAFGADGDLGLPKGLKIDNAKDRAWAVSMANDSLVVLAAESVVGDIDDLGRLADAFLELGPKVAEKLRRGLLGRLTKLAKADEKGMPELQELFSGDLKPANVMPFLRLLSPVQQIASDGQSAGEIDALYTKLSHNAALKESWGEILPYAVLSSRDSFKKKLGHLSRLEWKVAEKLVDVGYHEPFLKPIDSYSGDSFGVPGIDVEYMRDVVLDEVNSELGTNIDLKSLVHVAHRTFLFLKGIIHKEARVREGSGVASEVEALIASQKAVEKMKVPKAEELQKDNFPLPELSKKFSETYNERGLKFLAESGVLSEDVADTYNADKKGDAANLILAGLSHNPQRQLLAQLQDNEEPWRSLALSSKIRPSDDREERLRFMMSAATFLKGRYVAHIFIDQVPHMRAMHVPFSREKLQVVLDSMMPRDGSPAKSLEETAAAMAKAGGDRMVPTKLVEDAEKWLVKMTGAFILLLREKNLTKI